MRIAIYGSGVNAERIVLEGISTLFFPCLVSSLTDPFRSLVSARFDYSQPKLSEDRLQARYAGVLA